MEFIGEKRNRSQTYATRAGESLQIQCRELKTVLRGPLPRANWADSFLFAQSLSIPTDSIHAG